MEQLETALSADGSIPQHGQSAGLTFLVAASLPPRYALSLFGRYCRSPLPHAGD